MVAIESFCWEHAAHAAGGGIYNDGAINYNEAPPFRMETAVVMQ